MEEILNRIQINDIIKEQILKMDWENKSLIKFGEIRKFMEKATFSRYSKCSHPKYVRKVALRMWILCVRLFCLHICLCITWLSCGCNSQKMASEPLELELQMVVVSLCVDSGNWTHILWKSCQCSQLLSCFFSHSRWDFVWRIAEISYCLLIIFTVSTRYLPELSVSQDLWGLKKYLQGMFMGNTFTVSWKCMFIVGYIAI